MDCSVFINTKVPVMKKRLFDIVFSAIMIVLLSPLMLLIAILIKLTSPGPVLFVQQRIGQHCKPFSMYKFRTMEFSLQYTMSNYRDNYTREELIELRKQYKTTSVNDKRITRIGKYLRRFYLDELPQFINVLKGDMSVIGPRPDPFVQQADYTEKQWHQRHKIKPGITGLSQLFSGSPNFSVHKSIALDLKYAKQQYFCREIWIIISTFKRAILKGSF